MHRHFGAWPLSYAPFVPQYGPMPPVARLMAAHMACGELLRLRAYAERQPPFITLPEDFPVALWEAVNKAVPIVNRARRLLGEDVP